MGKILVTGASGNVGSYVVKYLLEWHEQVVCASTNVERIREKYKDMAEAVYFDFKDIDTFHTALKGVDRVFLMRPPHLGKPEDLKPFIDSLKKQGGIRMVSFLSLIGIENNPVPPHYKIEKYIEQTGLPYCHIRPSFFMQNISGVHAFEIQCFDRIVVPVKKALTSFIDAEDIGELTAKILSEPDAHKNCGYSITGPKAIDYFEVGKILSEELNRDIRYVNPSPSLAKKYWITVRGLDKEYAGVMAMLYMMTRMGAAKKVTTSFEDIMGRKPQNFRQFARKNRSAWEKISL